MATTTSSESARDSDLDRRLSRALLVKIVNKSAPKVCLDFVNTSNLFAARGTFLSGFAFIQIGSYGDAPASDGGYICMATMAFAFAIIASFIANVFIYYLDELVVPSDKVAFCESTRGYVRGVFRIFMVASLLYLWGLARVGFAYYPDSHMKWCPFAVLILASLVLLYGFVHVVALQLKLQTNGAGNVSWLLDPEEIVRNSKHGVRSQDEKFNEMVQKQCEVISSRSVFVAGLAQLCLIQYIEPSNLDNSQGLVCAYLYLLSATLTTALSFVSGFVASTIEVFLPDTEVEKQLAYAILVYPTVKYCYYAYILSFFTFCITVAFLGYGLSFTFELCKLATGVGVIGLILIAGGVLWLMRGYRLTKKQSTVDAANAADMPANGFSTDHSPLGPLNHTHHTTVFMDRQFNELLAKSNNCGSMTTIATGYVFQHIIGLGTLITNDLTDAPVTCFAVLHFVAVISGLLCTVYDSILTVFANEFIDAHQRLHFARLSKWMFSLVMWCYQLTLVCWLSTFTLGGLVQFVDAGISMITVTYGVAAAGLAVAGSVYFNIQYQRFRSIPYLEHHVNMMHTDSNLDSDLNDSLDGSEAMDDVEALVNQGSGGWTVFRPLGSPSSVASNDDGHRDLSSQLKRQEILNIAASGGLFLGGFCYDAVAAYQTTNDNIKESMYLHLMCLGTITAIVILHWTNDYNNKMESFHHSKLRLAFADRCYRFYTVAILVGFTTLISIMIGFPFIGEVQFGGGNSDGQSPLVILIWSICAAEIVLTIVFSGYILRKFRMTQSHVAQMKCDRSARVLSRLSSRNSRQASNADVTASDFVSSKSPVSVGSSYRSKCVGKSCTTAHQRVVAHLQFVGMENQMATTNATSCFIAYCLCEEILVSRVDPPFPFATNYYYGMCTITFSLSMVTIAVSALIRFLSGDLKRISSRLAFSKEISTAKHLIFGLNVMALFCWLGALIALGHVKYGTAAGDGDLWLSSAIVGIVFICWALRCFFDIKNKSRKCNSLFKEQQIQKSTCHGTPLQQKSKPLSSASKWVTPARLNKLSQLVPIDDVESSSIIESIEDVSGVGNCFDQVGDSTSVDFNTAHSTEENPAIYGELEDGIDSHSCKPTTDNDESFFYGTNHDLVSFATVWHWQS